MSMNRQPHRVRGRRIVTITKPSYQFYIRRCCSVGILLTLAILPLFSERRLLAQKIQSLSDYVKVGQGVDSAMASNEKDYANTEVVVSREEGTSKTNATMVQQGEIESRPLQKAVLDSSSSENMTITESKKSDQEHDNQKLNVFHFPSLNDDGIEMFMELDGLEKSKAINLVRDANASMLLPNIIWVGSPVPGALCNMDLVTQAIQFFQEQYPEKTIKEDWTFNLFDWDDHADDLLRCKSLELLVGKKKVHYWKRSIVIDRHWNASTRSIELGRLLRRLDGVKVRPLHLSTRNDIVDSIAAAAANWTGRNMTPTELSEYVVTKERPGDVIHHWPATGRGVNRGNHKVRNDLFRIETSLTLANMTQPPYNLSDVFCGLQGRAKDRGRASTTGYYIDSILNYKIVVVTQRDIFEGHLRLFEGWVSGAMILHDRIVAPPAGLEENVNIVYFESQQELQEKVMYYLTHSEERLRIARNGRKVGMCQSRTWHRMEQILLGRTVTPCDE